MAGHQPPSNTATPSPPTSLPVCLTAKYSMSHKVHACMPAYCCTPVAEPSCITSSQQNHKAQKASDAGFGQICFAQGNRVCPQSDPTACPGGVTTPTLDGAAAAGDAVLTIQASTVRSLVVADTQYQWHEGIEQLHTCLHKPPKARDQQTTDAFKQTKLYSSLAVSKHQQDT